MRLAAAAVATVMIGAALAAAAPRPKALAGATPGLWEIAGVPGVRTPARECVADPAALAQFEHRKQACSGRVLNEGESSAVIGYECGGREFGRSRVTVITPRSLRIETQGISGGLPFNYVLRARRVADCSTEAHAARH